MLRSVFSFVQRQIPQAAARARPASAAQCSCFSSSSIGGRQPLHTGPKDQLFLHVSPSGDCWTGQEIFAAKHLQPDYVRSIPVPDGFDPDEHLISGDDEGGPEEIELLMKVYDDRALPPDVLERFRRNVASVEQRDPSNRSES